MMPRPDTTRPRSRPMPKKFCEAELCEAEARDAVLTINY